MKRINLLLMMSLFVVLSYAQDDEYQKYLESLKKEQTEFQNESKANALKLAEEYNDFKAKANAEFAAFRGF